MRFALLFLALCVAVLASMVSAEVPSTPLKVTLTNGNVVITPPVKNFTAIDPTTNATAYPVPTWARLTAKEKTASTQGQALLNATGYPFVYGYVPTSGLKNTTNYTLAAVSAVGTAVNATATALNFTSPVAGLGSDLAQAINNAIKTTNAAYNLTVGKAINATVYKVAVLPPKATVGKVNVTDALRG